MVPRRHQEVGARSDCRSTESFSVNDIVITNCKYRLRLDGTFDIDYEDGEFEMKVPEDLIRVKEGGAASSSGSRKKALEEGDKVEANYKGKGKWYPGVIKR